jgi:hypothetical protein
MSSGDMLTAAEIESLRENIRLGLELMRVAWARDDAITRGATTAELQEIEVKMESLRAALKANDSRQRR